MSDPFRKALCCTCGNVRDFRRARNVLRENYWLRSPINRDWHRETGDLKCDPCGAITKHALLHADGDTLARDHAERLTRIALGSTTDPMSRDPKMVARIQASYRKGRTPNPYLSHVWNPDDAAAAAKNGLTHVVARCGEKVKLPSAAGTTYLDTSKPVKPTRVRDQEYEDLDTGMSWLDMDCVDCYRYVNEQRLVRRRKLLTKWLIWVLADPGDRIPDGRVDQLLSAFEALR